MTEPLHSSSSPLVGVPLNHHNDYNIMTKIVVGEAGLEFLKEEANPVVETRPYGDKKYFRDSFTKLTPAERLAMIHTPSTGKLDESGLWEESPVGNNDERRSKFQFGSGASSFEKRVRIKGTLQNLLAPFSIKVEAVKVDYREELKSHLIRYKPKNHYAQKKVEDIKKSADLKSKAISMRKDLDESIWLNSEALKKRDRVVQIYGKMTKLQKVNNQIKTLQYSEDLQKLSYLDRLERNHSQKQEKARKQAKSLEQAWHDHFRIEPEQEKREVDKIHLQAGNAAEVFQDHVQEARQRSLNRNPMVHGFEKTLANTMRSPFPYLLNPHLKLIRHKKYVANGKSKSHNSSIIYRESQDQVGSNREIAINRDKSLELINNRADVGLQL